MARPPQFLAEDVLREDIVELDNAFIVPPPKGGANAPAQRSGVFDKDRNFVRNSITFRPNGIFNNEPPFPDEADIVHLAGRYMFAGSMFGHFGHFLVDSLARIWAVEHLREKIDGVVFTPKTNGGNLEHVVNVQFPLMKGLGMDFPVINTSDPLRVDKLYVPCQGIGVDDWAVGSSAYRAYMLAHGGKSITPEGADKIYISRSGLPRQRSSYLSEKILEAHLETAGYRIIHPQRMSKDEQIAQYRAARMIISPDGSPLHLLAYVGDSDQRVAVIARRNANTNRIFEAQLKAFHDCLAVTINCLKDDWLPEGHARPNRLSWGELDMEQLFHGLNDAGFLPEGTAPWPTVGDEDLLEEIAQIEEVEGKPFTRFSARQA